MLDSIYILIAVFFLVLFWLFTKADARRSLYPVASSIRISASLTPMHRPGEWRRPGIWLSHRWMN